MRIAVIGAGHVGATTAYALMLRALVAEIVLIDADAGLAEAEAADLADANALARPAHIRAGDYADAAGAGIAIVTAGAATHGDATRLSVAVESATIVRRCVRQLAEAGFGGILLVAANPVDLMALTAYRCAGLPPARVIGSGTLLDSARLRQSLAARLQVAPTAVEGLILGEHGDSEVPAFSTVRIAGGSLERFSGVDEAGLREQATRSVRDRGYRIIKGKGYTSFGIATAIVRICEAIVRDERVMLPVSTLLTGQFGISDLYFSLPCILGAEGVTRVLTPDLTEAERLGLDASAAVLRDALAALDAHPAEPL